jgi:hypothetical protein
MGISFNLTKSIKNGDTVINTLELREPTVADIEKIGNYAYSVDPETGSLAIAPKMVMAYLVQLTALPPSTLRQMSIKDFDKLRWELLNFFGQSES